MNDTTWLAEDGRLLKDLRIAAGWDTHDFSRSASISVAQLRQLEDGGNELFYSQSIKFQLGRKLLKKLGADIVRTPEAAVAETPSLFGFSPLPVNGQTLEESLAAAAPAPHPPHIPAASVWPKRWVMALGTLGILAVAGVFGSQLLTRPKEEAKGSVAPTTAALQEASPVASAAPVTEVVTPVPIPVVSTDPTSPTPSPVEPTVVAAAPADQPSNACQWNAEPSNSFMPRGMDKPSTYVHFVANADANICIQDRNQKVTQVNLKAGEKITVRGSAPWRIQTQQWADVAVFFQGYRMPVPATASLVTLNPRTEPMAEPTAQSN